MKMIQLSNHDIILSNIGITIIAHASNTGRGIMEAKLSLEETFTLFEFLEAHREEFYSLKWREPNAQNRFDITLTQQKEQADWLSDDIDWVLHLSN